MTAAARGGEPARERSERHVNLLGRRLKKPAPVPEPEPERERERLIVVPYADERRRCEELRPEATDVAVVGEDPRALYLLPGGARNIYFLPYLLVGEAIEDAERKALVFRSGTGIDFQDEFDRQEFVRRFDEASGAQRRALAARTFYVELPLATPEFSFDASAFPFRFDGYDSNKDLAYRFRAFQFVGEHNLRGFQIGFDLPFERAEEAKKWKRAGHFLRIGLVFEVLGHLPRLWTNGMPATVCFARAFQIVDGKRSKPVDALPCEVHALSGERAGAMPSDAIRRRLEKYADIDWDA